MIEQYLAWSGFSDSGGSDDPMVKGGQDVYTTVGTTQWTVPEGVTMISVAVISAGQQGRVQTAAAAEGGKGGFVRWKNNIPVIPGEIYTLTIGNGGTTQFIPYGTARAFQTDYLSSAFGVTAGILLAECTTIGGDVGGTSGFNGTVVGGSSGEGKGGDSGTYLANGSGSSAGGVTVLGVRQTASSPFILGANFGGGGGAQARDSGNRQCGKGGNGAIRIMWGNGRAYPSTNIADRV